MAGVERPTDVADLRTGRVEYRLERRGEATVVVLHGGHMRAGLALGEETMTEAGYSVLVPSRPGYGQTALEAGRSPADFADTVAELCAHLSIDHVAGVIGISAGGRTALALAAGHPDLVSRVVLESSVGFLPWPDRRTRVAANAVFSARTEKATWAAVRFLFRVTPGLGMRLLLRDLSTKPAGAVLASLDAADRASLAGLFARMRSGEGFLNDIRGFDSTGIDAAINQPTLVVASPHDGAVPFAHAQSLVEHIPHAELVSSEANSHFIWFGRDYPRIAEKVQTFLARDIAGES